MNHCPFYPRAGFLSIVLLACAFVVAASTGAQAMTFYLLTMDGRIATTVAGDPSQAGDPVALTGVVVGETLVGIDVRPQNQRLYALGINATTNTGTLYLVSLVTNIASPIGTPGSITFVDGTNTPVAFPSPVFTDWDVDFNPAADRLRVVASDGTNFRVNPNTGLGVDGDFGGIAGSVSFVNPDGAINGAATTQVGGAAYTNNQPNNGGITTLYTIDAQTRSLYLQNPPNAGTETNPLPITDSNGGLAIDRVRGFDIAPTVNAASSNAAVTMGTGAFMAEVGGVTSLYGLDLVTGLATRIGTPGVNVRSFAIRTELGAAIALNAAGTQLVRFSPSTPGTATAVAITGVPNNEVLVGIDERPQTGQIFGLAVDAGADQATLYRIDPQSGAATTVGAAGSIAFQDGAGATVDLPAPAIAGYGFDFNPTVDRIRVVTSTGLNFRVNPNNGAPVDGDLGGVAGSVTNINTDANLSATGITGAAYTNSYPQAINTSLPTTLYVIDTAAGNLYIQSPPNSGTLGTALPLGGSGGPIAGFDIPSTIAVGTANTGAVGFGYYLGGTVGAEQLYRVNLATGESTGLGAFPAGAAAGLVVFAEAPQIIVEQPPGTDLTNGSPTIDFGGGIPGKTETRTFTLKNPGTHPLDYVASLDSQDAFQIIGANSGTVAGSGTADVVVQYFPAAAGAETDTLHIDSNAANKPAFSVALSGSGVAVLAGDKVTVTAGETILNPLANDGLDDGFRIYSVSDSNVNISSDGRTLFLPPGYAGTSFTYLVTDGVIFGKGTVTVATLAAAVSPKSFTGLLTDNSDFFVGAATATLSATNTATIKISTGTFTISGKISLPNIGEERGVFTKYGFLSAQRNADGTLDIDLTTPGGFIFATLRATASTATAATYNVSLQSPDVSIAGGGYLITKVKATGAFTVAGILPDGTSFSAGSRLGDNSTLAFFAKAKGPKVPSVVGGQLAIASLLGSDISGELAWVKFPQPPNAKGLHLDGVDTNLVANGSLYTGVLPTSAGGILELIGGNLNADEKNPVVIMNSIPALAGSLKSWTTKASTGLFTVTVQLPGVAKPVKGTGVYLPTSGTAFGFFPGITDGGRVELSLQ